MCRSRSNRTDEWRPFLSRARERATRKGVGWRGERVTRGRGEGGNEKVRGETFLKVGRAFPVVSREARIPGRGMRVRRKRGEPAIVLSAAAGPLNLPADLFTIVPPALRSVDRPCAPPPRSIPSSRFAPFLSPSSNRSLFFYLAHTTTRYYFIRPRRNIMVENGSCARRERRFISENIARLYIHIYIRGFVKIDIGGTD